MEASNGADAIVLAASEKPDAILLDVMMPGMDGPETLETLKVRAETVAIPVVFLTAKAMTSEIDRLRSLGAAGVITKPFDPLELGRLVRAFVDGS